MQPISGRTWLEWIRLSRIFRAPFANLSLEILKKWVDTISYLVFRGSSANLSPTCTFLERYLSRRHLKSMPVDLDYIKPFMGFCTTLIYVYVYWSPYGVSTVSVWPFWEVELVVGTKKSWLIQLRFLWIVRFPAKNRQTLFVYSLKKIPKKQDTILVD